MVKLTVRVLTTGFWPVVANSDFVCNIPIAPRLAFEHFKGCARPPAVLILLLLLRTSLVSTRNYSTILFTSHSTILFQSFFRDLYTTRIYSTKLKKNSA